MSVMRIKDENGNWQEVAALTGIQGPEGPAGPAGDTKVFVVNMYDLKTADATAQEIRDAVASGRVCILRDVVFGTTYLYAGEEQNPTTNVLEPMFVAPIKSLGIVYFHPYVFVSADGNVTPKRNDIKTPTPLSLKLTGAVEAEFDGSEGVTVEIPEGGGASKYAQPDWGAEIGLIEILPRTELTVDEEGGGIALGEQEIVLTVGETYTVVYNGTDYSCVAISFAGMPGVLLGNGGAVEESLPATDDPFLILAVDEEYREDYGGASFVAFPLDGSTTITLAIKSEGEIIHTIPSKYVEGGGRSKYAQPEWGKEAGAVVLPEITVEAIEDSRGAIVEKFTLEAGQTYNVNWNGTLYTTTAVDVGNGGIAIGNLGAAGYPADVTEEPYIILRASDEEAASEGYYAVVMFLDGSTSAILSIAGDLMHKIPAEYVEEVRPPLLVNTLNPTESPDGREYDVDYETIVEAINAGRQVHLSPESQPSLRYNFVSMERDGIVFMTTSYIPNTELLLYFIKLREDMSVYEYSGRLDIS